MLILGLTLAILVGLSLGMLGGGGSILTVPILVYVLGFAAKPAIAMSLPVVGVTSLVGALLHWRLGNVRIGMAALFGGFAMVGAYGGAKLAVFMSGTAQLVLLAVVMLVAAASMLRGSRDATPAPDAEQSGPSSARLVVVGVAALGVGVLTGLVGIGGGFLVVPALVLLLGVDMRQAVGTSLVVITMNSAAGFAGYLGTVDIEWRFLAGFTVAAVVGVLAGTAVARRVPRQALRRIFAIFLVVTGALILYQNRAVFAGGGDVAAAPLPSVGA